jgi:hypothetical protein
LRLDVYHRGPSANLCGVDMPSLGARLGIYTKPPPGECDGGRFVECCTDLAGRTACSATKLGWFVGLGPGVALRRQRTSRQWDDPPEEPTEEHFLEAKASGYTGTVDEFVRDWQAEGIGKGFLDELIPSTSPIPNAWLLVGGAVAGGAAAYFWGKRSK